MRLRRETGDFQITINSESEVNTIRPNLSAEDFVGEMVDVDGTFEVVNAATNTESGSVFKTNSFTLTYTKATGAITAEEGGSDGGESGGSDGGGSSAPRFLDVYEMSNSSVIPGEFDPLQDPSAWDISDWDFTGAYYLGENLTAEDIASMIPCYIYEADGVRTIDTCGAESDLLDKGVAFCGLKVQPFDKHINVSVYFGEDGATLEMGVYFSETGYIVNPTSLIPIPDPDPDPNDPVG